MFRLTAVLVVGLYATLVIWGDPRAGDVAVTRDATMSSTLPGMASPAAADTIPQPEETDLSDVDASEALQMALAAGEKSAPPTPAATERPAEEAEPVDLWYVTGARVNLRAGPSTGDAIVGGVSQGDRAEVLSDPADSWIRIRTERGVEAWIYGRFLSETPA